MSITREQVADLQPGDVVELICVRDWNVNVRGELRPFPLGQHPRASITGIVGLTLGPGLVLRRADGGVAAMWLDGNYSLVVVSRAPRPLYVNHPRTEPVRLDVACDADAGGHVHEAAWISAGHTTDGDQLWVDADAEWCYRRDLPKRLRLLVDGETGQVVP